MKNLLPAAMLAALTPPSLLETARPISLARAILFVYNKAIMDNNVIVLRSCGFDPCAMAKSALAPAGARKRLVA